VKGSFAACKSLHDDAGRFIYENAQGLLNLRG
jgi:hypothetical protein